MKDVKKKLSNLGGKIKKDNYIIFYSHLRGIFLTNQPQRHLAL